MDSRFAGLIFFFGGLRPIIPQPIITIYSKSFWLIITAQKETLYVLASLHNGELQCSGDDGRGDDTRNESAVLHSRAFLFLITLSFVGHGHGFSFATWALS